MKMVVWSSFIMTVNMDEGLNVGRIFVVPEHFRKGYGIFMIREIEKMFLIY